GKLECRSDHRVVEFASRTDPNVTSDQVSPGTVEHTRRCLQVPARSGAGGGIRTHEGLRHGITHPRSQRHQAVLDTSLHLGLECSARMLRRDPPIWSAFDLTLVPPLRNRLVPYGKYILSGRQKMTTEPSHLMIRLERTTEYRSSS